MKKIISTVAVFAIISVTLSAQELRSEIFDMLNLDYPGLETVKALHETGDDEGAAAALLDYYRGRVGVKTPEIQDVSKVKINKEQQKWADEALEHTFYVHKGYQPSFNYGEDIDWKFWPVKDNELRWQLHRHYWFAPMGYAYRVSGDEKYAKEWVFQYMDWIRKNPYAKIDRKEYEINADSNLADDAENTRFAWRPLEVSHRLQDQCLQFQLFIDSPHFTKEFLTEFLNNYHKHADLILHNYSEKGNHLLFEAQRMIYAGSFFPEFKEAHTWLQSGIDVLNKEINVQVYDDGGQFELDPHYHLASINIFIKALQVADLNGFRTAFPQSYIDTIEKMIVFYANICYPDYSNPLFSDARATDKKTMIRNYREWSTLFPNNQYIKYLATEGKEGKTPEHLSKGFLTSGFFVFRNGWGDEATQMVVKAGPKGEWHCQPDNGTFELRYNGKTLFQDSGSYVYGGDEEVMEWRNWFRATAHHNTLSLDNKDLETTQSQTLLWQPEGDVQILVTENPSYKKLSHRRTVFFVDNTYFVIVDEAVGEAKGRVSLHYQMPCGDILNNEKDMTLHTNFEEGSNLTMRCFGPEGMNMEIGEGWISTKYREKTERMDVSFNVDKTDGSPVRYITVIYPKEKAGAEPLMSAEFEDGGHHGDALKLSVKVGKEEKRVLEYRITERENTLTNVVATVGQTTETVKYTDGSAFPVFGKCYSDTTSPRYDRLPAHMKEKVRKAVWSLSRNSAGLYIRFRSNSSTISTRWTSTFECNMDHMPATGVRGLDLYIYEDGRWRFAGTGRPSAKTTETTIVKGMSKKEREYMLYLSLYDGIETLEIGVDPDAEIDLPMLDSPRSDSPIVAYGTSILQGGCASRPGMAHTNILSRTLDKTVINLGFSGNALLDYEIAEVMADVENPSLYILDYVPNAVAELIRTRGETFFHILRDKHPDVPVVFIEDPTYPNSKFNLNIHDEILSRNKEQKALYERLEQEGEKKIYYISSEGMIGDDGEATVDGTHFTDLGMTRYVNYILPTVLQLLECEI